MTQLNRLIDPTRPLNLNGDVLNGAPLGGVSEWLTVYVKAEQGAREAGVFEAISMPALLQSRAYALALERTCRSPC
jgi:hypothetical protein